MTFYTPLIGESIPLSSLRTEEATLASYLERVALGNIQLRTRTQLQKYFLDFKDDAEQECALLEPDEDSPIHTIIHDLVWRICIAAGFETI